MIAEILPELIKLKTVAKESKSRIEVYEGKEGIKTLLSDLLKSREILGYGAVGKFEELLEFYFPNFIKKRIKSRIKAKLIFNESELVEKKTKLAATEIRTLPKEFETPQFIHLYENKIMIVVFSSTPYAILIEDKIVNRSFRKYFDLLWNVAKRL